MIAADGRHVWWNAGYFGCIHSVRENLPKATTKQGELLNNFVAGAIGGTFGTMINTPFVCRPSTFLTQDVVKSRIQNTIREAGVVPKYNWTYPAVGVVYREEGFRALYKGFAPKVLRLGPGGGVLLVKTHLNKTNLIQVVFDQVMQFFRKIKGEV